MNRKSNTYSMVVRLTLVLWTLGMMVVMVAAREAGYGRLGGGAMLSASTGFLVLCLAGGALRSGFGRWVFLALLACWLGDNLGARNFVAGLGAFLVAHLLFMCAFWFRGIAWRRTAWALPVLALTVGVIVAWLYPHVPRTFVLPVGMYMGAITGMVLFAAGTSTDRTGRLILLAALLFFISDIFVARWRFVSSSPLNIFGCYPIYYTACTLFALSVWPRRAEEGIPS